MRKEYSMKTRTVLLVFLLTLCLLASGCGKTEENIQEPENSASQNTEAPVSSQQEQPQTAPSDEPQSSAQTEEPQGESVPAQEYTGEEIFRLADPVMNWWELYNPNGFDTLTAELYNPNDVPVEVTYDLVYYKDGVEIARSEDFFSQGILPEGRDLVWANVGIPKAAEADDVKLENVTVSMAYYLPIDGKYKYAETVDGEAYFDFEFDSKPTLATVTFLLYSDKNGNKSFDKGEIVVTSTESLTEQTGRVSFITEGYDYTDYEVYFTAY